MGIWVHILKAVPTFFNLLRINCKYFVGGLVVKRPDVSCTMDKKLASLHWEYRNIESCVTLVQKNSSSCSPYFTLDDNGNCHCATKGEKCLRRDVLDYGEPSDGHGIIREIVDGILLFNIL